MCPPLGSFVSYESERRMKMLVVVALVLVASILAGSVVDVAAAGQSSGGLYPAPPMMSRLAADPGQPTLVICPRNICVRPPCVWCESVNAFPPPCLPTDVILENGWCGRAGL